MPTVLARTKFREAQYFLAGMRERDGVARLDRMEEFGYYLSAFLSAARSVSFVLRKENPEHYESLRDAWLGGLDPVSRALSDDMVEHRNAAQKQGRVPFRQEIQFVPWLSASESRASAIRLIRPFMYDGDARVGLAVYRLEVGDTERPAVEACESYLSALERLVVLFE